MCNIEEMVNNLSEEEAKDMLIDIIEEDYSLVEWPESQKYMEEPWFDDEAIDNLFMDGAYFIPLKRIFK